MSDVPDTAAALDVLLAFETRIGRLYSVFAERLPHMKNFWRMLEAEERAHADVVEQMIAWHNAGQVTLRIANFHPDAIRTVLDAIERQGGRYATDDEPLTSIQACSMALDYERSPLEQNFFDVFHANRRYLDAEFHALREHTREHAKRVARALEDARADRVLAAGPTPIPNLGEKIRQAQHGILENVEACESGIADLYAMYAAMPDGQTLPWARLSKEEQMHARAIRQMRGFVDGGYVFEGLGKFGTEPMREVCAFIEDARKTAAAGPVDMDKALQMALSIESSLLDAHFFHEVHSHAPGFNFLARHLGNATKHHADLVVREMHGRKEQGLHGVAGPAPRRT